MATKKATEAKTIQVDDLAAAIAAGIKAANQSDPVDEPAAKEDDGKLYMKNKKGEMLMCELTIQKKVGAPDPVSVTVNEERYYLPRGVKAIVPWYFVQHLLLNVTRQFTQEKTFGPTGIAQYKMIAEDVPAEAFNFREIDPAPDNPPFQQPKMIKE